MSFKNFWAEGEFDKDQIGEILNLIVNKSGLSDEEFAKTIDCPLSNLKLAKEGKGMHVYSTFEKTCKVFNLRTKLKIDFT